MEKSILKIQNLKCGGCANTIFKKLETIAGVSEIGINEGESLVSFLSTKKGADELVKNKLKELGYPVVEDDNSLFLKAKSYVSCAKGRVNK